jgi:hypothetical protein
MPQAVLAFACILLIDCRVLAVLLHLLGGFFETAMLGVVNKLAVIAMHGQVVLAVFGVVDVKRMAFPAAIARAFVCRRRSLFGWLALRSLPSVHCFA